MDDLIHELTDVGFSDKEAAVYLATLEIGRGSVVDIAKRAQINRPTAYDVLESLALKGLVTAYREGEERRYIAEPPERILTLLHLQSQELEMRRRLADQLLLRLKVFHNLTAGKPKMRYIESLNGLRAMQREYETLNEDFIQIVGYDTFVALSDSRLSREHQESLGKRKRKVRSILVTDRQVTFPPGYDVEFVTISPTLCPVKGEMTVCGDRLVLFSYTSGIIAIEIISKTIADTARATLELAWREAQKWAGQKKLHDQSVGSDAPSG